MPSIFQNKYVRYGIGGVIIIFATLIFVSLMLATLNSSRSTGLEFSSGTSASPSANFAMRDGSDGMERVMEMSAVANDSVSYPYPEPTTNDYTADLESYETTTYNISGQTREFDSACSALRDIKERGDIHFKSLSEQTNRCSATFFTSEAEANNVLARLTSFSDIEYTRNTTSVTRHRQQLLSRTNILEQQLASAQKSLASAEVQFDELAEFARVQKDASALSEAIRYKLQNIDTLTQRVISLNSQLDNLYQQAADLEARLGVVEFSVYISRFDPIIVGEKAKEWQQAWNELEDQYTKTLIGLSAFFGIFLLWTVRITIYVLVVIIIIRLIWKFIKKLWKM